MILSSRSVLPWRGVAAAVAAALIPAIAGCEAGFNAPTQQWHQPTPGASAVVNNAIRLSNVFVLGAAPDSTLAVGESAGLFLALSNEGAPDRLLKISAPGTAGSVQLPAGGIAISSRQPVLLTGPSPRILLQGLRRQLRGGQYVTMVFEFQRAGLTTLRVPVMPRAAAYATFSPAPASPSPASPSATPTPTPSARRQATPSPSPSATG